MFTHNSLRAAVFALTVYVGNSAVAQDSSLSTTPLSTLPQVSSERLGTGVPSRLPKVDVQRPVFTIQSGGPVAMPIPQFRPIRETTVTTVPGSEIKSNLPMTEQSRQGQKTGTDYKPTERQPQTYSQARTTAPLTTSPRVQTTTSAPRMHLTAELPAAERKATPAKGAAAQAPLPRPATVPQPTKETPARVLNFSIN